jgi:hypothetical protein
LKDYLDPAYRDRVIDSDGKERLLVEEQVLGSQRAWAGSARARASYPPRR